jgi:hypothetical protein
MIGDRYLEPAEVGVFGLGEVEELRQHVDDQVFPRLCFDGGLYRSRRLRAVGVCHQLEHAHRQLLDEVGECRRGGFQTGVGGV